MKNTDLILILEDKEEVIKGFLQWIEDASLKIELEICRTYAEYEEKIGDKQISERIKCIIIDLSNNKEEETSDTYKSTTYIKEQYEKNRIPIFIHSGFLENFKDFDDKGTVFKVEKSTKSISKIGNSIELMYESGFLDIFPVGGTIETKIMEEIHNSFVEQFKKAEIQEIIKSIKDSNPHNIKQRTQEIFERIALRAVYQNTISNLENQESVRVNAIEHYYRRTDVHKFWTGDIFKNNQTDELVFLATPRCNISNKNFELLLFYKIKHINDEDLSLFQNTKLDTKTETKGEKQIRRSITDDVSTSTIGERFRFLPKTPQFCGGYVDCRNNVTMSESVFIEKYEYVISLVDDLTNDVIRKAAAYLLRGGISDTNYKEASYYFKASITDEA